MLMVMDKLKLSPADHSTMVHVTLLSLLSGMELTWRLTGSQLGTGRATRRSILLLWVMLMVMAKLKLLLADLFYDGTRNVAQLIEWNGANLAVDRLTTWYWTSNTVINSVALGDVDGDGQIEVVTGGYLQ